MSYCTGAYRSIVQLTFTDDSGYTDRKDVIVRRYELAEYEHK